MTQSRSKTLHVFADKVYHDSITRYVLLTPSRYLSVELKNFVEDYLILCLLCISVSTFSTISILSHRFPPLKQLITNNYVFAMGFLLFALSKLASIDYFRCVRHLGQSNSTSMIYALLDPVVLLGFIVLLSIELASAHLIGFLRVDTIETSVFAIMNIAGLCLSLWLVIAKDFYIDNLSINVEELNSRYKEYDSYHDIATYFTLSSCLVGVVALNGLSLTLFNYNVADSLIKAFISSTNRAISAVSTLMPMITKYVIMPLMPLIIICLKWISNTCHLIWINTIHPTAVTVARMSVQASKSIFQLVAVMYVRMDSGCRWMWGKLICPMMIVTVHMGNEAGKSIYQCVAVLYVRMDSGCRLMWGKLIRPMIVMMVNIYYLLKICAFMIYKLVIRDMVIRSYLTTTGHLMWLWLHRIRPVVVHLYNGFYAIFVAMVGKSIYYFLFPSLMLYVAIDGLGVVGSTVVNTMRLSSVPIGILVGGETYNDRIGNDMLCLLH